MQHLIDRSVFSKTSLSLMVLLALFAAVGCQPRTSPKTAETSDSQETLSGHEQMRQILAEISKLGTRDHTYLGDAKANQLRSQLERLPPTAPAFQQSVLLTELGQEELNLDQLEDAIQHLNEACESFQELQHPDENLKNRIYNRLRFTLGVAYMRLGETQNCCARYTGESCIVPIQGAGIHKNPAGSEQAIECFLDVLSRPATSDVEHVKVHEPSKWLLNIAFMTIGRYPAGVPEKYRIAEEFFTSPIEFPRFENVYPKLGLDTFNLSGGAIIDDFNNDGYLDIFTTTYDTSGQTQYFENQQDGTFHERTKAMGLEGFYGGLNAIQGDYDNDGDLDVFIPRGAWLKSWGRHPNSLLRNDGDRFTDVTFEVGLGEVHYPTKTAAWADYDNDGDLDLYVGNETTPEVITAPAQLFRNDGGRFTDVAAAAGLQEELFAMGAVWGDFNQDSYPDLFVSNGGDNRLYQNQTDGTFEDVADAAGVKRPAASFPAWFWDYDNDGSLDLYVGASSGHVGILSMQIGGSDISEMTLPLRQLNEEVGVEMPALYRGDGEGGFTDVAASADLHYPTLPMGANFGDLNLDGFPDFYLGTGDIFFSELMPNVMFLNDSGNKFVNVTMAGGFGHLQKGHAVAFADLDNDGDQDVYMQMGGAYRSDKFNDALYENPGFETNHLTVCLEGRQSNRSAIGARICATVQDGAQSRKIFRYVTSGGSFGCNPLRQAIGLGAAKEVDELEIFWPASGITQRFENLKAGQTVRIVEGVQMLQPMELKPVNLGDGQK